MTYEYKFQNNIKSMVQISIRNSAIVSQIKPQFIILTQNEHFIGIMEKPSS